MLQFTQVSGGRLNFDKQIIGIIRIYPFEHFHEKLFVEPVTMETELDASTNL